MIKYNGHNYEFSNDLKFIFFDNVKFNILYKPIKFNKTYLNVYIFRYVHKSFLGIKYKKKIALSCLDNIYFTIIDVSVLFFDSDKRRNELIEMFSNYIKNNINNSEQLIKNNQIKKELVN